MQINDDLLSRLEAVSRIELSPEENSRMKKDIARLLEGIECLLEAPATDAEGEAQCLT